MRATITAIRYCISDNAYDVSLDIPVFVTSDLLEVGYSFCKMAKTSGGMENRVVEVYFSTSNSSDAPFDIMVPALLMPMVERLRSQPFRRYCMASFPYVLRSSGSVP